MKRFRSIVFAVALSAATLASATFHLPVSASVLSGPAGQEESALEASGGSKGTESERAESENLESESLGSESLGAESAEPEPESSGEKAGDRDRSGDSAQASAPDQTTSDGRSFDDDSSGGSTSEESEGDEREGGSASEGTTGEAAGDGSTLSEQSGEGVTSYETAPEIEPGTGKKEPVSGKEKEPAEFSDSVRAGRYTVRIHAEKGVLPKGTTASVRFLTAEESRPYAEKAEQMAGEGIAEAVIDIEFRDPEGKEIQPAGMVSVVFENAAEEDAEMSVYHAKDSDAGRMEEMKTEQDGKDIAIQSDSFSPYVLLAAGSEPNWTKGGKGSWKDVRGQLNLRFSDDDKHYYQLEPRGFASGGIGATFTVLDGDGKRIGIALCINPGLNPASSGTPDRIYECDCPMLVKAFYYGAYGPGNSVITSVASRYGLGDDLGAKDLITHFAASKIAEEAGMSKSGDSLGGTSSRLKEIVKAYVREIEDQPTPDYWAYVFSYNDTGRQDFGFGSALLTEHTGKAQVRKEPENPVIVKNNDCYTIEKAYYRIYKTRAQAKALSDEGILAKIVTDENGLTETVELEAGTYYLVESKASKGYEISKEVTEFTVTANKTTVIKVREVPAFQNANLRIVKKSSAEQGSAANSLEGTQFMIKYYDGYYTASNLPEKAYRTWILEVRKSGSSYVAQMNDECQVGGGEYIRNGNAIILPLGTITIRETKAAPGYLNDGKFGKAEMYVGRIRQKSEGGGAELVDISGERTTSNTFEVYDTPDSPGIGTSAVNLETGKRLAASGGEVTIRDTVTYKNLVVGKKYVLKGHAVDRENGKPVTDADGKEVAAEKTFTPSALRGETYLDFSFRTDRSFSGRSIVFFESVETAESAESGEEPIAAHENIEDEGQTIRFPGIRTTAVSAATNDHIMPSGKEAEIRDTVSYKGLIPGKEYTVKGTLMVREETSGASGDGSDTDSAQQEAQAGRPLEAGGKKVTSEKTFIPETSDGKVELTFSLDASGLAGRSLVVFEELYEGSTILAEHKEIGDKGQTVHIPDVETDAYDKATGKKNSLAAKDRMITDKVTYRNLIPGKTYEITGEVKTQSENAEDFDHAQTVPSEITGAEILSAEGGGHGGKLTFDAEKVTFVPEGDDGETVSGVILVSYQVDASALAGKGIVFGEKIRYKGVDLAVHRDLKDERQADYIPKGQTMAIDTATGIKNSLAAQNRVFKDTFRYENLLVGETYRITGRVMASGMTGEDGAEILEEIPSFMADESGAPMEGGFAEFVPKEKNGTIDLFFAIDATELGNRDVTVFEKVTLGGEPVIVHEVLDGTQTISIPEGGTSVIDSESRDRISAPDAEVTVLDTLAYRNLIPGKEYTARGRLVRKSDGEEIPSTLSDAAFEESEEGSSVSVSDNVVTFTPMAKDGALVLTFVFDASDLKGEDTVVFERIYYNGSEVIVHENIDDERQTIHLPDGHTTAGDSETGDRTVKADGTVVIRDSFHYENLLPGREYAVRGKIMLKPEGGSTDGGSHENGSTAGGAGGLSGGTAAEIDAQMVDAKGNRIDEWRFTPAEKSGSEDLFWEIRADDLAGQSAVVFETLAHINAESGERTTVIVHEDMDDEEQTIHFPDGGTRALDRETGSRKAEADGQVTVQDEVTYRNLIPGHSYTVTGTLMDKETGKPILEGQEAVTNTVEFVPETPDGTVTVEFTFNGKDLAGHSVVAFEKVFSEGKEVFAHEDPDDKEQTIEFPKRNRPPADKTRTGDDTDSGKVLGLVAVFLAALSGLTGILAGRKGRKRESQKS